ncbi:MAG: glycosyltransferase family 2 protein [Candidatus Omnitrophota bacterium]
MEKKLISIMSNCYNEEENVDEFYRQVMDALSPFLSKYDYELLFIDNASNDGTVNKIKSLIEKDRHVRLIVNARNFGQIRSPYYGFLQARGDAVIPISTDLQDPPPLIRDFIKKWEEGFKNVVGIKSGSKEHRIKYLLRKLFYKLIGGISEVEQIENFTGFGLYDRKFIDLLRGLNEPYPYFRGLVAELGLKRAEVPYVQAKRHKGRSKHSLYVLYDLAMLGFVNHSKLPLRLASFIGFSVSLASMVIGLGYLAYKLLFWSSFQVGIAPLVIGIFLFGGIQLFFLGIIGEYIGAIFTQVKNHPLVVEKERVNF